VAIILVIEHIAIAKAMGRLYNYTITPSQEIVALGGANMLSPFVGGYVCTGSFGASAVLSKAGVRTPLAGLFSAMMLVLALYALTGVFYYIPNAALAGLIIHAVCNLITPPKNLYKYWQLSPLELLIWIVGVALAIFKSLEYSIYVGIGLSLALLLVRVSRTKGRFIGVAHAQRVAEGQSDTDCNAPDTSLVKNQGTSRTAFLPLDRRDASNPGIRVQSPYPGVFIYRLTESFNYINQAYHVDTLLSYLVDNSRQMSKEQFDRESDRLWNDPGPRKHANEADLPYLRALILDFSAVNNLDVTSVQGLIDLRNSLDRYSSPDTVEWHFANVHNRWTRRALACSGFGYPTSQNPEALGKWKPIYSIAPMDGGSWYSRRAQLGHSDDEESIPNTSFPGSTITLSSSGAKAALYGVDRPFFHSDLHDAVEAAVRDARNKDKYMADD
jgi:sodium-independent sulfate anion transporter 11